MAGAVLKPQQATGTVDMTTGQTPSRSANSLRISFVVDRLLAHVRGGSRKDTKEFFNLCLSLSRGIDFAVANKEVPVNAPELPGLLKEVCKWKTDIVLTAAIMVLLISIKGASRNGWFSEKDKEELQNLSNEISSSFCSDKDMNSGVNTFHHNITPIMLRFYPSMKMGEVLAFVEATPGYGAFVKDFDITTKKSSDDKIYLFVAQMDDTETSSCIISPQQVNFLLNGKAVDGRNCVYKDPGPQCPTLVTHMLKSGTNLLQVLGHFHGKYIILVAYMSMVSNPSCPSLPNYVSPPVATLDSDNEIIEGASTISLNCPISFKRINTPVKGHLCKHPQCFDYENYVDINSRRPSWRCPHCTQSVSFTDIRVDHIMVKVLKEVGMNVSHVKMSADGSWEAVNEGDDHTEKPPSHQEPTCSSQNMGLDIMDLTEGDNYMNATDPDQDIDKKPSPTQLQNHSNNPNNQIPANSSVREIPIPPHMENRYQRIHLPNMTSAAIVPPVQNATSHGQSQISASNNVNGSFPTHTRHVTRIPIAVQALPAQTSSGMVGISERFDGFHMNPHHAMHMNPPPSHMGQQEFGGRSSAPPQQSSGYGYGYNSGHHQIDQQNFHQHHSVMPPQVHQRVVGPTTGFVNNQQAHHHYAMSAGQQGVQVNSWTPSGSSMPVASSQEYGGQAPRILEGAGATSADQNWRPSGRMRGSLSGQAYEEALSRYMYFPTQPLQASRPPLLNTPRPVIPPHLQFSMANNRNMTSFQDAENWRF